MNSNCPPQLVNRMPCMSNKLWSFFVTVNVKTLSRTKTHDFLQPFWEGLVQEDESKMLINMSNPKSNTAV